MISLICDDSVTKNESILEYVGQETDPAIIYVSTCTIHGPMLHVHALRVVNKGP